MLGRGPGAIIEIVRDLKPEYITHLGDLQLLDPTKYAVSLLQLSVMGKRKVHIWNECHGYLVYIPTTMSG